MPSETLMMKVADQEDPYEDFFQQAYDKGWTDGLPVIPPTPARVQSMLAHTNRDPQEVIGIIPPRQGKATVEKIAVNAVMAGCRPEYLPVVIATIEAISDPRFPMHILQTGTSPQAPWFLVNGPIRNELDINCGIGCMGPGWRANSTIGRAGRLILINVGGALPGVYTRTTFSWPHRNGLLIGENEEYSPWEPFHVEHGCAPETNTATAFRITDHLSIIAGQEFDATAKGLLVPIALSMVSLGSIGRYQGNIMPVVLLSIERAKVLADHGLSKADVKQVLYEKSAVPASYFHPVLQQRCAERGRLKDGLISLVDGPQEIHVLVAGGPGAHTVIAVGYCMSSVDKDPIIREIK